jgi:hypothetical protein
MVPARTAQQLLRGPEAAKASVGLPDEIIINALVILDLQDAK